MFQSEDSNPDLQSVFFLLRKSRQIAHAQKHWVSPRIHFTTGVRSNKKVEVCLPGEPQKHIVYYRLIRASPRTLRTAARVRTVTGPPPCPPLTPGSSPPPPPEMMMCCLMVLDTVTSTPQWIRQPRPRVYLKEGTYPVMIRGCLEGLALMI